jgi:hypothetical protein
MTSIQSAIDFLRDPKVAGAPLTQQIAFLEAKGLSQSDIQKALSSINSGSTQTYHPVSAHAPYGFTDYTIAAGAIAAIGYAGTFLVQVNTSHFLILEIHTAVDRVADI